MSIAKWLLAKKLGGGGGEAIIKRKTGNPIELTDAASAPLVKCVTQITGSQDLHGYDKPWVGGAGKNKLNKDGYILTVLSSDDVSINVAEFSVKNGVTYTISCYQDGNLSSSVRNTIQIAINGTNLYEDGAITNNYHNQAGWHSIIVTANSDQTMYVRFWGHTLSNDMTYSKWMVEESNTPPTTYEPYSNICPITAYTEGEIEVRGRNILDANNILQDIYIATDTMKLSNIGGTGASVYGKIKGGTTYTVSKMQSARFIVATTTNLPANNVAINDYRADYSATKITIPTTENDNYLVVFFYLESADTGKTQQQILDTIMVEEGSVAHDYEPYTSTTHTTTYPSAIYRGSEDCVEGSVTGDLVKVVFDGSSDEGWSKYTSGSAAGFAMRVALSSVKASTVNMISSYLQSISINATWGNYDNWISTDGDGGEIITGIQSITTVEAWKSYLSNNPLEVVYELKTPINTPVTVSNLPIRTISGYNHIESSTGEMVIDYITDQYQNFVDTVESALPNTRKGGAKAMDIFLSLEKKDDDKAEVEKEAVKEETR